MATEGVAGRGRIGAATAPGGASLAQASIASRSRFPLRPLAWRAAPLLLEEARRGMQGPRGSAMGPARMPLFGLAPGWMAALSEDAEAGIQAMMRLEIRNEDVERVLVDGGFIRLPREWAEKLEPGSLRESRELGVARGELACNRSVSVQVRTCEASSAAGVVSNMLRFAADRHLQGSGHVLRSLERRRTRDFEFLLEEAVDQSMEDFIASYREREQTVPLNVSLPLLVDMLRGVRDLDMAGFSHCSLQAAGVKLVGGRALLADLVATTATGDTRAQQGGGEDTNRAVCTVEAVGRIFARMNFEGDVLQEAAFRIDPDGWRIIEGLDTIVGLIVRDIKSGYDIKTSTAFRNVDPDVRDLIAGLLSRDPASQLTAEQALERAEQLAGRRGVQVLPARAAPVLPTNWYE